MYINITNWSRPQMTYIPFGTIGYVKTTDNEVRQCKCLGGKTKLRDKDLARHDIEYEWKVAGYKEHFFTFSPCCLSIGHIYKDEESAQRGRSYTDCSNQRGEMEATTIFPIFNYLINKYGMSTDCFKLSGTWNNCFSINTYAKLRDNTTYLKSTDFEVIVNETGIDCVIPMLDGRVDGIQRYPTAEKAYAAMKPLKTYLLDDDDDDDAQPEPTKLLLSIEVDAENIEHIKKYATIL